MAGQPRSTSDQQGADGRPLRVTCTNTSAECHWQTLGCRPAKLDDGSARHHHSVTCEQILSLCPQVELFSGIDCLKQSVELNMETNTDSVCSPKVHKERWHFYGPFLYQLVLKLWFLWL